MKTNIENWKFIYIPDSEVAGKKTLPAKAEDIYRLNTDIYPAVVPGCLELDLMRLGILPDLRVGENILLAQELEDRHIWYFSEFTVTGEKGFDEYLVFDGIDTAAEIFVDGELFGKTENMFIPFRKKLNLEKGSHEVVVHIIPAAVYASDFELPIYCSSLPYNLNQLKIRKAPYMFGWDIMPRCVSAGIWKPAYIEKKPATYIEDVFVRTVSLNEERAVLKFNVSVRGYSPFGKYGIVINGKCPDSEFEHISPLFSSDMKLDIRVDNPRLWMPHNYGEPNLYDITVSLTDGNCVIDTYTLKTGIRMVELERTSCASENGRFLFKVNNQPIFFMGSNWVPTDIFPSEQAKLNIRGLEMIKDLGCNIIRCWGGNIYPDDNLFDYCDENGIMVWQDFAMACGTYPNDDRTQALIGKEAEYIVKKYRNHASLLIWSGDNECDQSGSDGLDSYGKGTNTRKPDDNLLTRKVIPEVLSRLDNTRPYIPSSPYIDNEAFENGHPAEDHLWGPRDYFKGIYYMNANAHFVSETGYHGCPDRKSLEEFLEGDNVFDRGDTKECTNRQWLTHASSPVPDTSSCYAYRIPLMTRQVERLFGYVPEDLDEYVRLSQISQAEAFKFFIEHSRIMKWHRSGIIWWNLIDGWPQISDAVVDWYGRKKLAYDFIKKSQQPFCIMCDEPENGKIDVYAVNDLRNEVNVSYEIHRKSDNSIICSGMVSVKSDDKAVISSVDAVSDTYLLSWTGDVSGTNHYTPAESFRKS